MVGFQNKLGDWIIDVLLCLTLYLTKTKCKDMRCPCMAWLPLSVNISIVQLHFVIMPNDYVYNVNVSCSSVIYYIYCVNVV